MPTKHSNTLPSEASATPDFDGKIPSPKKSDNTGTEKKRSNNSANNTRIGNKPQIVNIASIPKIDVIEGIEANRIASNANRILLLSVSINGLIFFATAILAYFSIKQAKYSGDIVKETQKEFSVVNQPYLQVTNFKLDTFNIGKPIYISFDLENLGNYPIKIDFLKGDITLDIKNPGFDTNLKESNPASDIINTYIIKGTPSNTLKYSTSVELDEKVFSSITYGEYSIWVTGQVIYHNIISNEKRVYKFIVNTRPNEIGKFVINDNETLH